MAQLKAVVIPADEDQPIRQVTFERGDTDYMREVVGGWFAASEINEPPITLWYEDEGKIKQYPINRRATALWWSGDFRYFLHDALVGDVLITGNSDEDCESTSVPQDVLDLLFATDKYKAEFLAAGETSYATNQMEFDSWWMAITYAVKLAGRWKLVRSFRVVPA